MTNDLTVLAPVSLTDHLGVWENSRNKGASAYNLDAIAFASVEDVRQWADMAKAAKAAKASASEASARAQGNAYAALVGLAVSAAGRAEVLRLAAIPTTTKQGKVQGQGIAGAMRELGLEGHAPTWGNLMAARAAGLALTREGKVLAKTALEQALKAFNAVKEAAALEQVRAALQAADAKEEEEAYRLHGTPTSEMVREAEKAKAESEAKAKVLADALGLLSQGDESALPFLEQIKAALAAYDAKAVQEARPKAKAKAKAKTAAAV